MTDRSPAKIRRAADAKAPGKAVSRTDAGEVARLKGELAQANARIAELEQRQAEVASRIDWIIDSLQNPGE